MEIYKYIYKMSGEQNQTVDISCLAKSEEEALRRLVSMFGTGCKYHLMERRFSHLAGEYSIAKATKTSASKPIVTNTKNGTDRLKEELEKELLKRAVFDL